MSLDLKRKMLRRACEFQDQSEMFQYFRLGEGLDVDAIKASEAWEEMYRAGLFAMAVRNPPRWRGVERGSFFFVTERGRAFLKHAEAAGVPEDQEGFMRLIKRDGDLDPFVETVVGEALWAYNAAHPVAAVMCLFAATWRAAELRLELIAAGMSRPRRCAPPPRHAP